MNKDKHIQEDQLETYYDILPIIFRNVTIYTIPIFIYLDYYYIPSDFTIVLSLLSIVATKYSRLNFIKYIIPSRKTHISELTYKNIIPFVIVPMFMSTNKIILLLLIISGNYYFHKSGNYYFHKSGNYYFHKSKAKQQ
jgi:hypothetical protein